MKRLQEIQEQLFAAYDFSKMTAGEANDIVNQLKTQAEKTPHQGTVIGKAENWDTGWWFNGALILSSIEEVEENTTESIYKGLGTVHFEDGTQEHGFFELTIEVRETESGFFEDSSFARIEF